jgi:trans-2,3-dihydro-3-hydroxyanthranilate isomerase
MNDTLPYRIVDVFTTEPLAGNPLAVFTDASRIDEAIMQKIAQEMNLAETTFVLPAESPAGVARVRIFTPKREMAFAGHPTIGTAFVLFQQGRLSEDSDSFFLEENVGPVQMWVERGERPLLWLKTPAIYEGPVYDRPHCAHALGLRPADLLDLPPQILTAGNPTLIVALKDQEAVDRAWLDAAGMKKLRDGEAEPFCVFVFCRTEQGAYSRMFAPDYGVPEDPATGSSTGPLAAFMMRHGLLPTSTTRFVSEQGKKMGRRSLLYVRIAGSDASREIFVGGHVAPIAEGVLRL